MYLDDQLKNNNVILHGHFKLSSERHSDTYINKDRMYCKAELFRIIVKNMEHMIKENFVFKYDVITGPAVAGAILASPISMFLRTDFVYPEKNNKGNMVFNRGYDTILKDKRVLIIEDIITTGSSVLKTRTAIENCGGIVVGVVSIWNRSRIGFDIPLISLINTPINSWEPEDCPLCKKSINLTNPKTGEVYVD